MARKKKKQRQVYRRGGPLRHMKPALYLAGGAAGASVIHSAMPAGTGAGLGAASTGMASMVGPVALVGGVAMTYEQMKKLKPKRRKRRSR